jgi:hypothetical protein
MIYPKSKEALGVLHEYGKIEGGPGTRVSCLGTWFYAISKAQIGFLNVIVLEKLFAFAF